MYLLQILLMSDYVGFTHLCLVARPTFCIACYHSICFFVSCIALVLIVFSTADSSILLIIYTLSFVPVETLILLMVQSVTVGHLQCASPSHSVIF